MRNRVALVVLLSIIVLAHIAMWRSEMPRDVAMRFTIINAIGWSIVLLPILLVNRWLKAVEARNISD